MIATQYLKINKNLFGSLKSYTTEFENDQKQLNFLHTTITTDGTNSYDFKIFRKLAITNVMKPNSNMAPNTTIAVFKSFLSVVYKSSSKCFIDKENQYLIDFFTENGNERKILEKMSKSYLILSLPLSRCAGHNTDLPSNSNISKMVRVKTVFTRTFFKVYSISFLITSWLIDFALVVL